jgi:hypothetical protein
MAKIRSTEYDSKQEGYLMYVRMTVRLITWKLFWHLMLHATSNYSAIANSHNLQFTTAHT